MRVADKFGPGQAKVTLSFDEWAAGKVAPATYQVAVPAAEK